MNRILLFVLMQVSCVSAVSAQDTRWPDPVANDVLPYSTAGVSHGPLLGAVTDTSVKIWLRTRKSTSFEVLFDQRLPLTDQSERVSGRTLDDRDNTAVVRLNGLKPNTRYYYAVRIDGALPDLRMEFSEDWPSFKTLPNRQSFLDARNNPTGLFNVAFAVGHCASQDPDRSGGMYANTPAYETIGTHHADEIMFALVNGDVIYEEQRDGSLEGIRDNYKLYFSRGRSFASLFRRVPALFTFDDHDVGWDIHGCGQIGLGEGRHLIRDLGLRGYEEYLSWANFRGPQSGRVRFGKCKVTAGSDLLFDAEADFTKLVPGQVSTIHLGNYTRGEQLGKRKEAPRNAGVYGLIQVVDRNHLRVSPGPQFDETLSYSIGAHHYYDWQIANCHFIALDTRGERSSRNPKDRADPNLFVLGPDQEKWFINKLKNTNADFVFVFSPDPWVIYHTAAHVGGDDQDDKGDGFPSFLDQRERLLRVMDDLDKQVLIFTGDVHASASVKITDNVHEMMCGPLGSTGHPLATLGNPPTGGRWNSMGRDVEIRWVTGFPNNVPYQMIRNTYYGIVQVNNVLKVASPEGGYQFTAYDEPQVVVRWHDGYTGRLVYAESLSNLDLKKD